MKVSIITVVFNGADTIKQAIESVLSQKYTDIEYVIIDGASKDETIEIIRSYGNRIAKFISEPDKGLYDAMNKGLALASGDVIGILNADDFYADADVISDVVASFAAKPADSLYADLLYVDKDNPEKVIRYWKSGQLKTRSQFAYGWMPPHPTFFVKRDIYVKFGVFDTHFTSAADYELMLRLLYKHHISVNYLPRVTTMMRVGGKSNQNIHNRIHANNEDKQAWVKNGLPLRFYTMWLKPIRKVPQFFKKYKQK
jgi:glycosyltransferase involved in cell wall biosynthesis